jgi:hypothetical protein
MTQSGTGYDSWFAAGPQLRVSRREENRFSLTCSTPFPGSVGLTLAFEPHGIAPTMTMESGELDIEILERR